MGTSLLNAGGYRRVLALAVDVGPRPGSLERHRCSPLLRVALALFTTTAAGFASTIYSVSPIPIPSGFYTAAMFGINDSGQVAG